MAPRGLAANCCSAAAAVPPPPPRVTVTGDRRQMRQNRAPLPRRRRPRRGRSRRHRAVGARSRRAPTSVLFGYFEDRLFTWPIFQTAHTGLLHFQTIQKAVARSRHTITADVGSVPSCRTARSQRRRAHHRDRSPPVSAPGSLAVGCRRRACYQDPGAWASARAQRSRSAIRRRARAGAAHLRSHGSIRCLVDGE